MRRGQDADAGTNRADELYLDSGVLQPLAILGSDCHSASDGFTVHVDWSLFPSILIELQIDGGFVIVIVEDNVNVGRGGEKVG